jgi:hypothetical protein
MQQDGSERGYNQRLLLADPKMCMQLPVAFESQLATVRAATDQQNGAAAAPHRRLMWELQQPPHRRLMWLSSAAPQQLLSCVGTASRTGPALSRSLNLPSDEAALTEALQ